eukprot:scaffold24632_cov58-Skeletonema_marinoi.AAC.1
MPGCVDAVEILLGTDHRHHPIDQGSVIIPMKNEFTKQLKLLIGWMPGHGKLTLTEWLGMDV